MASMSIQLFIKTFLRQYDVGCDLKRYQYLLDMVDWSEYTYTDQLMEKLQWDSLGYCRNTLHKSEQLEIVLITWLPGQRTYWHGHPEHGCLMKVLVGSLEECQHNVSVPIVHSTGSVSYVDGSQNHQIINSTTSLPAVSLHIYSPGNFYNSLFDETPVSKL